MNFSLSSLVVAVLGSPVGDVDVGELLAAHLPKRQKHRMCKDKVDEGHVL